MNYITTDIVIDGVNKTQVYKIIGMEDENGIMVNIKIFDGEYTKEELLLLVNKAKENVTQSNNYVTELEGKLATPPTQEELNVAIKVEQDKKVAETIRLNKAKEINKVATLTDQLNLMADCLYILTEGKTEPKILEARKVLEDIRLILN